MCGCFAHIYVFHVHEIPIEARKSRQTPGIGMLGTEPGALSHVAVTPALHHLLTSC